MEQGTPIQESLGLHLPVPSYGVEGRNPHFPEGTPQGNDDVDKLAQQALEKESVDVEISLSNSAFNTIIPALLQDKLSQLHVPDSTCSWGNTSLTLKPSRLLSSPLLFSLYTNSCTSSHQSVKLLKFADDTTLIGLVFGQNNLELNALKTVEMVVDFLKNAAPPAPITLGDSPVIIVESFRFLGSIISQDLMWEMDISSLTKKSTSEDLKKFYLPKTVMVQFYTAITESILTSSITIWYAAATAKDKG
ncbi:hypothetical protein N1851_028543 [Merluccius polli]|uniref:Reverse transcriptase domain-containing protein n=1 Tax=Merluccius polli TaxID=89951 RepID=A0AA47M8H5_MERPO|nr:hypothetical protein N1851_028543 [Merluccius polli]